MIEKVITCTIQDATDGYTISYSGWPKTTKVPADALDVSSLASLAADAAEGYATTEEVIRWGKTLFQFLVCDRLWAGSFQNDLERSESVHLRLDIRSPALQPVPWEWMYDGEFLLLMPQVHCSRVDALQPPVRPFGRPIRVVVLTPATSGRELKQEADAIFDALSQAQRSGRVSFLQANYPSAARIPKCEILHVSGRSDDLLALSPRLVEVCQRSKPLVAYLSVFGGAAAGKLSRLMDALQQEGKVPVIIGASPWIPWSSVVLSAEFYKGMATGLSTAAAVARARRQLSRVQAQLQQGHEFDWTGLILYQSTAEGIAFSQAGRMAQATPAESFAPPTQTTQEIASSTGMMGAESDPWGSPAQPAGTLESAPSFSTEELGLPVLPPSQTPVSLATPPEREDTLESLRQFLRQHRAGNDTLDLLGSALQSPERRQQTAAVETLGLLGEQQPQARRMLIELVGDREGRNALVRRTAVEQLGHLSGSEALDALLLATTDPEEDVRRAARNALMRVGRQAQAEPKRVLLELPLTSHQAIEHIAPLRQAVVGVSHLSPREQIEAMKQVETLRFELIRSRPRPLEVNALLEALGTVSPEIRGLTMNLKGRIELVTPEPETSPPAGGRMNQATGDREGGTES